MTRYTLFMAIALLAGCEALATPTLTPTRSLSAPTLAASPQPFALPPSEVPGSFVDEAGANDPTVAALPNDANLPPLALQNEPITASDRRLVQVTATDGGLISGELYLVEDGQRRPGVLLFAENRGVWGGFPQQLADAGHTVLAVDMADADQFGPVFSALADVADPGRLAAIGEQAHADFALAGCADDNRCDTIVLLSPVDRIAVLNAATRFNPRPLLVAASAADGEALTVAEALGAATTGETLVQRFDDAGRGAAIIQNRPDMADLIITWLQRHLN